MNKYRKQYHKPRYHSYPEQYSPWYKYNFVCVPCRQVKRGNFGLKCPQCQKIMMDFKNGSPPKKQDRWWTQAKTWERWHKHQQMQHEFALYRAIQKLNDSNK